MNFYDYINKIKDKEDRLLLSTTIDKYIQYIKNKISSSTNFLNEYQYKYLCNSLSYLKIPYNYYICNDYCDKYIIYFGNYDDFVSIYRINGKFTHSEILGTLFSIGYTFDKIGDIIIDDNCCYITNLKKYDHLINGINIISNKTVELVRIDDLKIIKNKYLIDEIIVPSFRLDVIISKICNLSRSKANDLIDNKMVLVNYKEIKINSYILDSEDILSIRGYGKYKIGGSNKKTKKDNFILTIYKYN